MYKVSTVVIVCVLDNSLRIDTKFDDRSAGDPVPHRHYSVGSRPTQSSALKSDQYVLMCRSTEFTGLFKLPSHLLAVPFNPLRL